MIFPSGPTREPPPGYSIPEAIRNSGISLVIGPTTGMQQNSLLFPFDCLPPAHGVHLLCLTREILMQIQQPSSNQLPIDLIHCSICGARLLLSIRNQMDINRTSGTFPFYLFPSINNRGGITERLGLAVGPSLSPSGNPHRIVPTQPECNFCNQDRFDSPRSQLLCSLFCELAVSNGETYDEPRLAAFWVDRFSLDDLSLTPFSSLNEFVSPFTCDHEVHAGCFLWLIFHVFIRSDLQDSSIPFDAVSCIFCTASLHAHSVTRIRRRLSVDTTRFPTHIFPTMDLLGRTVPPLQPWTMNSPDGRFRRYFPTLEYIPPDTFGSLPTFVRTISDVSLRCTSCAIYGEWTYTDRLRAFAQRHTNRVIRSDSMAIRATGIEDVMPGARHVHLYEPCWPFNCADRIPLFFLEDMQERTAHWCHFGCMAMRLFMSAIAPNSIPSELRCYDSPSGPRFERQSCPEPISSEIIIHGAYSSASVRSTFRFGGHYSLLPSDHIPPAALRTSFLCVVCRWPFLTYDDFMTRSFIIQDIGGLDALREDALTHSTNYRLLASLDLELAGRSQWFPWSEASNRLQFASMDPTLSEDNFGEFLKLQPGCDHHTHRGCRTLRLALSSRMNIAALQHTCPVSNCPLVGILSPSPDSPVPICEPDSTAPPSVTQTPNFCAPGETPAPHSEVNTSVSCCICLEIDFDLLSFIQRQWTLNRECDLFDSRPAHYSAWYAIAEAGFYGVIPFALPQFMGSFSSIFACGHTMHLGCILSNWFDFCRLHPTYGCRPSDSFSCPMCRAGLNLDVTTYSQYWRIRSSFPACSLI